MHTRFLLGPAGSGKTFRCLVEIRAALKASPEGLPLLMLAPKQATFQLERQLLADPELPGYTRLQILSFERLAEFILAEFAASPPKLLNEEGRVMVLRALLAQKQNELKIFHATARLPGFAQQLSLLLRELQRHQLSPVRLMALADKTRGMPQLKDKLHDVALLLHAYLDWLKLHELEDTYRLLDLATTTLAEQSPIANCKSQVQLAGLWLDGFAEMTPQELDLLAALAPCCEQATMAFCLERAPQEELSWLSAWSVVAQTFRRCFQKLEALPGCEAVVEVLDRHPSHNRFEGNPVLAHLEKHWTHPPPLAEGIPSSKFQVPSLATVPACEPAPAGDASRIAQHASLRIVACANPDAEATMAARAILQFVRGGGRFREVAVVLRQLEGYHDSLRRVFTRYEIPFFLDRREPVAHHPLAELTRSALRVVTYDWRHEDWFGALKTGLFRADEAAIDALENEAFARGWEGKVWRESLPIEAEHGRVRFFESLRQELVPPFAALGEALASGPAASPCVPTGAQLAEALRAFWNALGVPKTLQAWGETTGNAGSQIAKRQSPIANTVHSTVWQQMQAWLDNLALAFPHEALPLREWLPILEAGLNGLTVGVVPPALDQVLIGTVDRSRNPDLQLALVLGANESIFPATPSSSNLLTESDRKELEQHHQFLGPTVRQRIGHERYYGYIACTRARRRLVVSYSLRDTRDKALNPSPFIAHLQRLFPALPVETFATSHWPESEHVSELVVPLVQLQIANCKSQIMETLATLPPLAALQQHLARFQGVPTESSLSPALAAQLYGPELRTSVSRMEQFAACPFKFFVHSGLSAQERKYFAVDARERGSFQHAVLARFHEELCAEGKRWRDVTPETARASIGRIAEQLIADFRTGLFQATDASLFAARSLAAALQNFIEAAIAWMPHYGFDPHAVELAFGDTGQPLPAWRLKLDDGHTLVLTGKIDRIDLARHADPDTAFCVVIDYKSGSKRLDPLLLAHGIQLQLLAYLAALRQPTDRTSVFGVKLIPAGVFYVNLRGAFEGGQSRGEVLKGAAEARRLAYQHRGRFRRDVLPYLDRLYQKEGAKSGQFSFAFNQDGASSKSNQDMLTADEFENLLNQVEKQLRALGQAIFAGVAKVDPYRKGATETACQQCDYRAICRIDPWTHQWRVLRKTW